MKRVGLVLLAAGGSRRLGTPKQMVRDAAGCSLIRRAALTATATKCHPIVCVLGSAAEEIVPELDDLPVRVIVNADWQSGMASSLRAGLHALTATGELDAALVMLCDQPGVTSALLDELASVHQASGHEIVACEYGGIVGVPALFGRALFGDLASLTGDEGARRVLKAYGGAVTTLAFPDGAWDIDTPEDAARLTTAASAPPRARPRAR